MNDLAGPIDMAEVMEILDGDKELLIKCFDEFLNDMLALKTSEKGVEFICEIHNDIPSRLKGDHGRLQQILINHL